MISLIVNFINRYLKVINIDHDYVSQILVCFAKNLWKGKSRKELFAKNLRLATGRK